MEALEHLQVVHGHLRLLQTHAIATSHAPTNRFLAEFLLLLGESGKSSAEMGRLCTALMDAVPKMIASTLFDEMAPVNTSVSDSKPQRKSQTAAAEGIPTPQKAPSTTQQTLPTQQQQRSGSGASNCMVSFKSMERARSTLEDFCRSYFMFHDMDVHNPVHVFRHLPVLVFVESFIYQLDEENEDQLSVTGGSKPASRSVAHGLGKDPFAELRAILHANNLLTKRIEDELKDGVEYWRLEQSLCTALSTREEVKIEDVLQAIRLKSFDYRVLNLLLYGLRNEPVNEAHYKFLSVSELLVEIADDLFDYEEDVGKNSFNVLRMFSYTYGPREAPAMLAEFIGKSEDKYQQLLKSLEPDIRAKYEKRCEEAVKEGGSKSVHLLGSWTIPSLITDEDAFRKQIMCEEIEDRAP